MNKSIPRMDHTSIELAMRWNELPDRLSIRNNNRFVAMACIEGQKPR